MFLAGLHDVSNAAGAATAEAGIMFMGCPYIRPYLCSF